MSTKKPSAFNDFMSKTLVKIKAENPSIKHTKAFSQAAALWKTAVENPKNK